MSIFTVVRIDGKKEKRNDQDIFQFRFTSFLLIKLTSVSQLRNPCILFGFGTFHQFTNLNYFACKFDTILCMSPWRPIFKGVATYPFVIVLKPKEECKDY